MTGVSRNFFDDKLELKVENYWSPEYYGETGKNNVLEFSYAWTFNKVGYFTPKLGGNVGRQWGELSEGGFDYTYWSVALTLGFNEKLPLELEYSLLGHRRLQWLHVPVLGCECVQQSCRGVAKASF